MERVKKSRFVYFAWFFCLLWLFSVGASLYFMLSADAQSLPPSEIVIVNAHPFYVGMDFFHLGRIRKIKARCVLGVWNITFVLENGLIYRTTQNVSKVSLFERE